MEPRCTTLTQLSFDIASLRSAYHGGATVRDVIAEAMRRCASDKNNAFIHRLHRSRTRAVPGPARRCRLRPACRSTACRSRLKDNIDLAGIPTTAGCPEFAYTPSESAFLVQRSSRPARYRWARPTSTSSPPA